MPDPEQKVGENAKVILGDDLGVTNFLYAQARLDFINIPYLSTIGARLFT